MAALRATRTRLNSCWELPSEKASVETLGRSRFARAADNEPLSRYSCWVPFPPCSQPFTLGAKPGIPTTRLLGAVDRSDIHYQSYTNRCLIGPTAERRLRLGLGVEGALYRHYSFWSAGTISAGQARLGPTASPASGSFRCWRNTGFRHGRAPSSTPASRGTPSRASGNP